MNVFMRLGSAVTMRGFPEPVDGNFKEVPDMKARPGEPEGVFKAVWEGVAGSGRVGDGMNGGADGGGELSCGGVSGMPEREGRCCGRGGR
ncbi:hypothetical protein GCM10017784_03580 [Deinococcus indicus]|nr:hypothetical protein GCM10017784_03580 [Deinococcus indicus]